MRMRDSRATKIGLSASTKAQALRVILASPSFRLEPRPPNSRNPVPEPVIVSCIEVLGGLREKKLFCPGNYFPCFSPDRSRIHSRSAKSFSPPGHRHPGKINRSEERRVGK